MIDVISISLAIHELGSVDRDKLWEIFCGSARFVCSWIQINLVVLTAAVSCPGFDHHKVSRLSCVLELDLNWCVKTT